MNDEYFYVHKSVLPDFFEKVIKVKQMLASGEYHDVSSAVKSVDISRSTYYKYKDHVFESAEVSGSKTAVIKVLSAVTVILGIAMLVPMGVSLCYGEDFVARVYGLCGAACVVLGMAGVLLLPRLDTDSLKMRDT